MRLSLLALLALAACEPSTSTATTGVAAAAGPAPAPLTAPQGADGATVVASWNGGSLNYEAAKVDIDIQLLQMEGEYLANRYDTEMNAVEEKVNKAIAELEAGKRKLSLEELMKKEVEEKVASNTEPEIQEAYAALARKFRGRPLEEVRPDVDRAVTQKKQGERYASYMADLRVQYGVNVTLPFPDMPRIPVSADDDPSEGAPDAAVTVIQFAEFQCPYCGSANETTKKVLADYQGKVRFVFRDFPLGFHENAIPAAVAANCANAQSTEKYWVFHDAFMKNQKALTEADFQKAAQDALVNTEKWELCRKDPAVEAEIRKDQQDGAAVGVSGTPAFFINGIFLNGAQPYEKFKLIIDAELAKKG